MTEFVTLRPRNSYLKDDKDGKKTKCTKKCHKAKT